jgi:hypothetical protein
VIVPSMRTMATWSAAAGPRQVPDRDARRWPRRRRAPPAARTSPCGAGGGGRSARRLVIRHGRFPSGSVRPLIEQRGAGLNLPIARPVRSRRDSTGNKKLPYCGAMSRLGWRTPALERAAPVRRFRHSLLSWRARGKPDVHIPSPRIPADDCSRPAAGRVSPRPGAIRAPCASSSSSSPRRPCRCRWLRLAAWRAAPAAPLGAPRTRSSPTASS